MKKYTSLFFTILALVLIAIIGNALYTHYKTPVSQNNSISQAVPLVEVGYTSDYEYATKADGSSVPKNLLFISPEMKKEVVPIDVATKISSVLRFLVSGERGGEDLNSGIMPTYSDKKDHISFFTNKVSCTDSVPGKCTSINNLYSYDLSAKKLNLLYTAPSISSLGDGVELMIAGIQGQNIIIAPRQIGLGGVCQSVWTIADPHQYTYLNLDDVSSGQKPYVISAEKIAAVQKEEHECSEKL